LLTVSPALADIGIIGPGEVPAGSAFDVKWQSVEVPQSGSISITAEDGSRITASYGYIAPPPKEQKVTLTAPVVPGTYGLVHLEKGKEKADPVTFTVTASVSAPDAVEIGEEVIVTFKGEAYGKDMILLLGPGEEDKRHSYAYPGSSKDGTVKLKSPVEQGEYRIVYSMSGEILAEHPLKVGGTVASLTAPGTATAGSEVSITWEGPNNAGDNIIIRDKEEKRVSATGYVGNSKDNPLSPPSAPVQGRLQGPPAKSKFLAVMATKFSRLLMTIPRYPTASIQMETDSLMTLETTKILVEPVKPLQRSLEVLAS
jgi:Ca-activated chloride channel family protein